MDEKNTPPLFSSLNQGSNFKAEPKAARSQDWGAEDLWQTKLI